MEQTTLTQELTTCPVCKREVKKEDLRFYDKDAGCVKCYDDQIKAEEEKEAKENADYDQKQKEAGAKFKTVFWIHGSGDDYKQEVFSAEPLTQREKDEILKKSRVKTDYQEFEFFPGRARTINQRTETGWAQRKNKGKYTCDICHQRLWRNPGNGIYCNNAHRVN